MRAIMDHREERERALRGHPLFAWLRDGEVPLGNRMDILPVSAPLPTMFRDLNMWVLRYPAPASPLQAAINAHTIEDATHCLHGSGQVSAPGAPGRRAAPLAGAAAAPGRRPGGVQDDELPGDHLTIAVAHTYAPDAMLTHGLPCGPCSAMNAV